MSLVATGAQASEPIMYAGKTTSKVAVRTFPSTYGKRLEVLPKGHTTYIYCKVNGPDVDGNRLWYHTNRWSSEMSWMPARYVANVGPAPKYCAPRPKDGQVTAKPSLTIRATPSQTAKALGTLKYGVQISTICKKNSTVVGGNPRWYQLYDGGWVPARYVQNLNGIVPKFCA
ncbi:SH3 domain-containing protein [Tenggerimyces flavus]|uniref:SH3 domain-containing protein n=1 Tax=Tenggerimyces flavus TaxID=1708749 RepID=A0ABV7YHP6_9ACTN|nr:SH3 domain-containing protein [Tenggerimyces flavus]MBM7784747.1 hypothetical protein [Tenggerimyces flavus]